MSVKNDYDRFIAEQKEVMKKELIQFAMLDQEKRYVEPFRIFGNVYYAGDSWVCVHVIDTGDGLLLIDSGNAQATAMLIHSIWSLGFPTSRGRCPGHRWLSECPWSRAGWAAGRCPSR